MSQFSSKFNLEDRTASFGEAVIKFCRDVKQDIVSKPIINQLVRSGTSVGANYCEANGASSKKDFKNKIHICKKEIQETKHWLRMIVASNPDIKDSARNLWQEAQELTLIFQKIINTLNNKIDNKIDN